MSSINLTHHFLIAMPKHGGSVLREDPDVHLRAQRPGRARPGGQPPDRHDLAGAVRAAQSLTLRDARARRRAGLLRRPGADRPRLRAARARRQLAVDAARARAHIGLTTSKDILEAVGRGEGPEQHARHARLRRLVRRASSSTSCRRTPGSRSRRATASSSTRRPRQRLPAAMELLGIDFARLQDEAGHA